jgi:hypothetical protein
MSPDTNKTETITTTMTQNRVDPSANQNETEQSQNRVDFPNISNGSGEESLGVDPTKISDGDQVKKLIELEQSQNRVDPSTTEPKFFQTEQNKPIENNNLNDTKTEHKPTLEELAQLEAVELFEKNKNNPCFLCKNFIDSIFSNRKGRKASIAKNCKKCDHAVKGKPNFYK